MGKKPSFKPEREGCAYPKGRKPYDKRIKRGFNPRC
jgi:hypothetical protein